MILSAREFASTFDKAEGGQRAADKVCDVSSTTRVPARVGGGESGGVGKPCQYVCSTFLIHSLSPHLAVRAAKSVFSCRMFVMSDVSFMVVVVVVLGTDVSVVGGFSCPPPLTHPLGHAITST